MFLGATRPHWRQVVGPALREPVIATTSLFVDRAPAVNVSQPQGQLARCARELSLLRGALETASHFHRCPVPGTELSGRGSPGCCFVRGAGPRQRARSSSRRKTSDASVGALRAHSSARHGGTNRQQSVAKPRHSTWRFKRISLKDHPCPSVSFGQGRMLTVDDSLWSVSR